MTSPPEIPPVPPGNPPAPLSKVDVAGLSREGRRASNEDSAAWVAYGEGSLVSGYVVVCDGMGGHNAGEVASSMALRLLQTRIGELASEPEPIADPAVLAGRVGAWISEINLDIHRSAASNRDQAGMGTTLALAIAMADGRLVVANVGDSKVFLVRGVVVQQLSVDHTALAEQRRIMGKDGGSALDDASNPFFHALTRSLGQEAEVAPDIRTDVTLRPGDLVIVTSDGVTDVLESERFLSIVEASQTLSEVAESTYRLSFEAGSKDNITVALLSSGKPTRLGSAPPPSGEIDLDGTIPLTRVRTPPKPVSGGTAMADGGRTPVIPTPPRPRRSLRTPLLVAAAAAFGCLAALAFWLTGRPPSEDQNSRIAAARPTAVVPATQGATARPTSMPAIPAAATVVPSPTVSHPGVEYEIPREDEPPIGGRTKPTAPMTIIKVPSGGRPERPGALPTISSPALPSVVVAEAKASPVPRAAEKPPTPSPVVAVPTATPPPQEQRLAIPGRDAKLMEVNVLYISKTKRYQFVFRFDKPVQEPAPGTAFDIPGDKIKITGEIRILTRGRKKLGAEGSVGWPGYDLRYDRKSKTRVPNALEFFLYATSTEFATGLSSGDRLSIDTGDLEKYLGAIPSPIEAQVFAGDR